MVGKYWDSQKELLLIQIVCHSHVVTGYIMGLYKSISMKTMSLTVMSHGLFKPYDIIKNLFCLETQWVMSEMPIYS